MWKYPELNYVRFRIHTEKDHFRLYKNATNQIFTFISSKVAYVTKNLAYQV